MDYDNDLDKLLLESHTDRCLPSDNFCKPILEHPYTFVWFTKEICIVFHICDFIGRTYKLNNRFWLDTDEFFEISGKKTENANKGKLPTLFPYFISQNGTTTPTLSNLELLPQKTLFR